MAATQTSKNIPLNGDTLLTRKAVCDIFRIGLSSLDTLETYKALQRVKIGRHTFFYREDVINFILDHRTGGEK